MSKATTLIKYQDKPINIYLTSDPNSQIPNANPQIKPCILIFLMHPGWNPEHEYNGLPLPTGRLITNKIITTETISPDAEYTHMLMQWGQFLGKIHQTLFQFS